MSLNSGRGAPKRAPEPDAVRRPPNDGGLSLDTLSAAFAEMLNSGADPYSESVDEPLPTDAPVVVDHDDADGACEISPRTILEATLFVGAPGGEPITSRQLADLMRGVRPSEIDALVRQLNQTYEARRCPFTIVAEGAGYRLALCPQYNRIRDKFYGKLRQARLSQAAIDVLAIVAYHEPLTADQIHKLRGTPSGPLLTQLVRRQLLRLDRGESNRRSGRYSTTPRFLELFGLKSLDDLPRSQDIDA